MTTAAIVAVLLLAAPRVVTIRLDAARVLECRRELAKVREEWACREVRIPLHDADFAERVVIVRPKEGRRAR